MSWNALRTAPLECSGKRFDSEAQTILDQSNPAIPNQHFKISKHNFNQSTLCLPWDWHAGIEYLIMHES
jgi:hypothetical protein